MGGVTFSAAGQGSDIVGQLQRCIKLVGLPERCPGGLVLPLRVFRQRAGIIADFDAGFFAQAKSGQVFPQLLHAQAVAHFADEVVTGIGDGLCDVL